MRVLLLCDLYGAVLKRGGGGEVRFEALRSSGIILMMDRILLGVVGIPESFFQSFCSCALFATDGRMQSAVVGQGDCRFLRLYLYTRQVDGSCNKHLAFARKLHLFFVREVYQDLLLVQQERASPVYLSHRGPWRSSHRDPHCGATPGSVGQCIDSLVVAVSLSSLVIDCSDLVVPHQRPETTPVPVYPVDADPTGCRTYNLRL